MGFGRDFVWGAATAAYQIEGAAFEDGKGLSVWDEFCRQPGRVFEGHTGDVACDHYHRYREDVRHMKEMGLQAYRFSISWPRILPEGTGAVNQKGLDFYSRLVDELLANGITPYATLFHWDYPAALPHRGGWLNPDSSDWFARYTEVVAKALGDRVKHFFTLNEPQCFIGHAHVLTKHAPGIRLPRKDTLRMAHNVMLAHGKAVQVLRANVPGSVVSYAPTGSTYYPVDDRPENVEAARQATFAMTEDWRFSVPWWSDPVMLGRYPDNAEALFGGDMPAIGQNDMKTICQPLDLYGQNIYNSTMVESDGNGGWRPVQRPAGHPKTAIGWPVTPESLRWAPKFLYERYNTPVVITENGLSSADAVDLDGRVQDPGRINFLRRYLRELGKCIDEGTDVRGYFQWSLLDNFEWSEGYNDRFGLIYVDYQTQQRIWKDSAHWYRGVIADNGASL